MTMMKTMINPFMRLARRRTWRGVSAVLAGCGLLVLASYLDPNHAAEVARDREAAKIRGAHEAKMALLDKRQDEQPGRERLGLDFSKLSFVPKAEVNDIKTGQPHYLDQAPEAIKAYNGRRVSIRGFMLPVRMEGDQVREFLIMASQMTCCYGTPPRFCDFIGAKKSGAPAPNLMDTPLTFEGVLKVGDVYEGSYWTQFYTLDCTAVSR